MYATSSCVTRRFLHTRVPPPSLLHEDSVTRRFRYPRIQRAHYDAYGIVATVDKIDQEFSLDLLQLLRQTYYDNDSRTMSHEAVFFYTM